MKKQLTKIFAPLLVVLIATSFFGAFTASVAGQTTAPAPTPATGSNNPPLDPNQTVDAQEKAMNIIKNVMPVDLSKYTIKLQHSSITNLRYTLTPTENNGGNSVITIYFAVEKDVVRSYHISPLDSQIITTTQYANQHAAVKGFLEKYQTYTNIDSSNLIKILDKVNLSKNSTTIQGNTKLAVINDSFFGTEKATLRWTYTVNGADYTALDISVNTNGFIISLYDSRALYTIGDTSINISKEKAIDIALENLKYYSYDMPDGSVVKDFEVSRKNVVATLVTFPVDYELQPCWDIRMMLDEVYPGNVQGITAFIWANTGEVGPYSNMAYGGTINPDNVVDSESTSPNYTLPVAIVAVIVVVIAVTAIGLMFKRRRK